MFRITKQTDYGIMLLARLSALPPGHCMTARDAAEWSGLSIAMVSKILKQLARERIVDSHRGVSGGYSLAEAAAAISVGDVIRALEGPIGMVECASQPGQCDQEPICPVRINWGRINSEVEAALARIPITEMIAGAPVELLSLGAAERPAHLHDNEETR